MRIEQTRKDIIPYLNEGDIVPMHTPKRPHKRQWGPRFGEVDSIAFTVTTEDRDGIAYIQDDTLQIRVFTPLESYRLMGFTDDEYNRLDAVIRSIPGQYRLAGNSIVVPILTAIFKGIYIDGTYDIGQTRLEQFMYHGGSQDTDSDNQEDTSC